METNQTITIDWDFRESKILDVVWVNVETLDKEISLNQKQKYINKKRCNAELTDEESRHILVRSQTSNELLELEESSGEIRKRHIIVETQEQANEIYEQNPEEYYIEAYSQDKRSEIPLITFHVKETKNDVSSTKYDVNFDYKTKDLIVLRENSKIIRIGEKENRPIIYPLKMDRYERFGKFLRETRERIDLPSINFKEEIGETRKISFNNGRHRFAYLRDHGAKAIPVLVNKEDTQKIKKYKTDIKETRIYSKTDLENLNLDLRNAFIIPEMTRNSVNNEQITFQQNIGRRPEYTSKSPKTTKKVKTDGLNNRINK